MNQHLELLDQLFDEYQHLNPSVKKIHELFQMQNETIVNDHIAFRTYNFPEVNIDVLAEPFIRAGYKEKGQYRFEQKKLTARHYELEGNPTSPKIFISQLMVEELSETTQNLLFQHVQKQIREVPKDNDLLFAGNIWEKPRYEVYKEMLKESEYAAWLYVFGFRANHFTVLVNELKQFNSLESVNDFLKENGYQLNSSGGEIKGTPAEYLEQSSTLADIVTMEFEEGARQIPACYYEFARRYPLKEGELFNGFIAKSADKIFESTDSREKA